MSILSEQCLSYSPMINASGNSIATRICTRLEHDQVNPVTAIYDSISTLWPSELGSLILDIGEISVDVRLVDIEPNEHLHLEVPSELTQFAEGKEWIVELAKRGFLLVLRGIPARELSSELIDSFKFATIDVANDRRIREDYTPSPGAISKRRIETIITGISTLDQMDRCFASGAGSIVGWPVEDAMERARPGDFGSSFTTISRLIQLIDEDGDPAEMENVLASDPSLAFRLFRFVNSAAFGLRTEIQSFEHAMMMLGRKPLKKWLALLLTTASKDNSLKPVIYGSVRRGFLLEQMLSVDADQETRESGFILGVFSMLDKLFGRPFEELFEQVYVASPVYDALVHNTGPAMPYLNLVRAIESSPAQVGEARDNAFVSGAHCNNSLIGALREANTLQMG